MAIKMNKSMSSVTSSSYSGYAENVYSEKNEQQEKVNKMVEALGFIPSNFVKPEVAWFYNNLGIDDLYFQLEDSESIARHIVSLYSAKVLSYAMGDEKLCINLEKEYQDKAIYVNSSDPGVTDEGGPQHEKVVDLKYLDKSSPECAYRLESYRSTNADDSGHSLRIRTYFVRKCDFVVPNPSPEECRDINKVSDIQFLEKANSDTLLLYSNLINLVLERTGPVIQSFDVPNSAFKRLVIAYRQGTAKNFFSSLSDLYHYYKLFSSRKYVEQFSCGITIVCLFLDKLPNADTPFSLSESIYQIIREVSLIYSITTTPFNSLFNRGVLSVQEVRYAHVVWIFAQHFLNKLGDEYTALCNIINKNDLSQVEVLQSIKRRLRTDSFTPEFIFDTINSYPDLIRLLYMNFAFVHYISFSKKQPDGSSVAINPTISFRRMESVPAMPESTLIREIRKCVHNDQEFRIFESILTFNKHVLKTNFYQPTKVALSFRLDPAFLPSVEYPRIPYGIFFVVGNEFRGFHVRFQDISRGGIRLIRSRDKETYNINLRSLFEENYNLALTQNKKNKDIPEGGSKGTILLDVDQQDRDEVAVIKYIDSVLDLLILGKTPGIKEKIVDKYGKLEMLFFGPDEGTADYMDLVCHQGRDRGAPSYRSLATGKSQCEGGIPHDMYGMTTRSVREFVEGIFRKCGLDISKCTKIQTGGPDGDLGSNEILSAKEKTLAIIDGSGVLYDPAGINREELIRLSKARKPIKFFEVSLIGPSGFRVLTDESDVVLPDGTVVESGIRFRNNFHLSKWAKADIFVPCGGRPAAVDSSTVHKLFEADGTPKFKYIVEGANLFFTQEARLFLENAGVILFKDASTNKGGVTSSSLEVLAALVFTDDEFERNMCVKNGVVPDFYRKYVEATHAIISRNARLEFEAIWKEHEASKTPRSVITDILSNAIINLTEDLISSSFASDPVVFKRVLLEFFPKILVDTVGIDELIRRIPENYARSIFSTHIGSKFIYECGISPRPVSLVEYLLKYTTARP